MPTKHLKDLLVRELRRRKWGPREIERQTSGVVSRETASQFLRGREIGLSRAESLMAALDLVVVRRPVAETRETAIDSVGEMTGYDPLTASYD